MPLSPLRLLLFALAVGFLVGFVELGILRIAFDKLGLSPESAYLLLMCTLGGSLLNLPLFSLKCEGPAPPEVPSDFVRWPFLKPRPFTGTTIVAINVGGAVVPAAFSLYLIAHNPLSMFQLVAAVAAVSYVVSRPIPGVGIGMPTLVAPLAAALIASLFNPEVRAPLAYVGGTLGVLIGADFIRLKDIRKLGAPMASIGGAGTFDGVFITGFVAVLLA